MAKHKNVNAKAILRTRVNFCECEFVNHDTRCAELQEITLKTIRGTFKICQTCNTNHPLPIEYRNV